MKIYHILSHTLEDLYPGKLNQQEDFSNLEHTVNRILLSLSLLGGDEYEHILLLPSKKFGYSSSSIIHKDGYKIFFFKTFQCVSYPFEYSGELRQYIKNIDDGIIHIYGTGSFLYDSIAPLLKHKKSIVHYMGGHFTWKFFPISFIKYFLIQPFTLRYPRILFIQNTYRINQYNKIYRIPLSQMKFVPGAVQISDFPLKNIQENSQNIQLFFASRIEAAKGIYELISVFKRLGKKYPLLSLIIAGAGSQVENVKKEIIGEENIHFVGNLDYDSLREKLYASDIFILPTHFDCFPSALLEAGAASLPSVSTSVEGPLSIIEDGKTGFLIPVGDTKSLYEKLEILINSPELRTSLGDAARKRIEEYFTWGNVANLYFETYKELDKK